MAGVLQDLVEAGLIDKLDGEDSRLEKMAQASAKLSADFRKSRKLLVPAILAGLDTTVSATDPLILKANEALINEWPTVTSVHADIPVMLLRGLLLDACAQAGEGVNAAILWLMAADTLPYSQLGREESTVRNMLLDWAGEVEKEATAIFQEPPTKKGAVQAVGQATTEAKTEINFEFDRAGFTSAIGAALGPHGINGQQMGPDPTPHWPSQNQSWVEGASKRLGAAVADQIEALGQCLSGQQKVVDQKLAYHLQQFQTNLQNAIDTIDVNSKKGAAENLRTDTLWWFEALYSSSLRKSYREIDSKLAAIVMAADLLALCPVIAPASVAHVLAEAVNRLHGATFDNHVPLLEILNALKALGNQLPAGWISVRFKPPADGRLCLRDTVVLALSHQESDTTALLRRASIPAGTEMSLPEFAKAVFRQEQALRLTLTSKAKA